MSKDLSKEEQEEIDLKAYVDDYFKKTDEAFLEWAEEKERERAAKATEEARAAERASVNLQESASRADELAEEEEAKHAN